MHRKSTPGIGFVLVTLLIDMIGFGIIIPAICSCGQPCSCSRVEATPRNPCPVSSNVALICGLQPAPVPSEHKPRFRGAEHMKLACIVAAAAIAPVLASAADFAGTWKLDNTFNGAVTAIHCTIEQKGNALTGSCKPDVPGIGVEKLTGTVTGSNAKWGYDLVFNGNPARVDFEVTLAADGSVTGTLLRNGAGSPIKGARQPPPK
jgi:hypothetical protein